MESLGYDVSLNGRQTLVAIKTGIPLPHRDQPPTRWGNPVELALDDLASRLSDDRLKQGFGQHFFRQVGLLIGVPALGSSAPISPACSAILPRESGTGQSASGAG
jgi:hypothetical protein